MTTTSAVQSKEVTMTHGKARYLEAGSGDPILLVHGVAVAGGADDWRPAIELLAQKYRVLAPDMLGWPPSDTRQNIDAFPDLTDFLREFQDVMGIEKSHVIGATMGGWIAGLFGYESSHRVNKLVLTGNPGFHGAPNDRLAVWEVPADDRVREAVEKMAAGMDPAEVDALVKAKIDKMKEPGYADAFKSTMTTMSNAANRKRFYLGRRLTYTKVPTLLIIGRGDPSSEVVDQLQKMAPNAKIHIIETGAHQVHYENTEEFCKVIADFLG
jgi:pimeloyl-ACP methyl ester carboxylesterase